MYPLTASVETTSASLLVEIEATGHPALTVKYACGASILCSMTGGGEVAAKKSPVPRPRI